MLQALQTRDSNDVLFFPLYGHDTDTECICSVLCINGINILLDCGWTEACDVSIIAPLAIVAPHIDLVRFPAPARADLVNPRVYGQLRSR